MDPLNRWVHQMIIDMEKLKAKEGEEVKQQQSVSDSMQLQQSVS